MNIDKYVRAIRQSVTDLQREVTIMDDGEIKDELIERQAILCDAVISLQDMDKLKEFLKRIVL